MLHRACTLGLEQVQGCSAVFGRRRRGSPGKAIRPVAPTRKAGDGGVCLLLSAGSVRSQRGSYAKSIEPGIRCRRNESAASPAVTKGPESPVLRASTDEAADTVTNVGNDYLVSMRSSTMTWPSSIRYCCAWQIWSCCSGDTAAILGRYPQRGLALSPGNVAITRSS